MTTINDTGVLDRLRGEVAEMQADPGFREKVSAKQEVYDRFSPSFQFEKIGAIKETVLREFLDFKNNKHWTGLNRQVNRICGDMAATRSALIELVDESKLIEDRMEAVSDLKGMGNGTASAILHVAYPEKYGIWNGTSQIALRDLKLMPPTSRDARLGERYGAINSVLLELSEKLNVDLWLLDWLWWRIRPGGSVEEIDNTTNGKNITDAIEKSISQIVYTVNETVKYANGQTVQRKIKVKELRMTTYELEARVRALLVDRGNCCAITGLPFHFEGEGDKNMRPSLDRIDSEGHYEASNIQLVCRFINFWKLATVDSDFRRLIQVVREHQV